MEQYYLYVIASNPNGAVKLGLSKNPEKRLKQLQTAHPERLQLYYKEPVDADRIKVFEKMLHKDIGTYRVLGEWFDLTVEQAILHVQHTIIYWDSKIKKPSDMIFVL